MKLNVDISVSFQAKCIYCEYEQYFHIDEERLDYRHYEIHHCEECLRSCVGLFTPDSSSSIEDGDHKLVHIIIFPEKEKDYIKERDERNGE